MDFNQKVFTINYDVKGFPYITTDILAHRVEESAELTTSPKGVTTKLFVNSNNELRYWNANGSSTLIQSFDSFEEARQEWLMRTYTYDYINNNLWYDDYITYDNALLEICKRMELDEDVVESLLRHHELYREIEAKKRAAFIMARYYKAIENSKGILTKKVVQATNGALYPSCYMYGRSDPYGSPKLDVKKYYTEQFKEDINNTYNKLKKG